VGAKDCAVGWIPGTGKTLLDAVAGEAGVPFFSISGSEFVEMFVGVGASRVRDLFEQASRLPVLCSLMRIVGRQRGAGLGGGNDDETNPQPVVDGDWTASIILLCCTNRPDVLDAALLRPGRFDRQVVSRSTCYAGRSEILKVHARGKTLAKDVV